MSAVSPGSRRPSLASPKLASPKLLPTLSSPKLLPSLGSPTRLRPRLSVSVESPPVEESVSAARAAHVSALIGELIESEEKYVSDLETLERVYAQPLRHIISPHAHLALFSEADEHGLACLWFMPVDFFFFPRWIYASLLPDTAPATGKGAAAGPATSPWRGRRRATGPGCCPRAATSLCANQPLSRRA